MLFCLSHQEAFVEAIVVIVKRGSAFVVFFGEDIDAHFAAAICVESEIRELQ